jgi:outer membrane protein assembly factor BamB
MWVLWITAQIAAAADWPQWLGPARNGSSTEQGAPAVWGAEGPRELWRVSGGRGMSGVVVAGGVAFTQYDDASASHLVALNADTGALLWDAPVGPPYIDGQGFHGPRATPTVVDDRVVNLTPQGKLFAVSRKDGRELWSVDLGALGGTRPQWGHSGSPLVSEGRVYASVGGVDGSSVAAFSLADGSVIWRSGSGSAAYSAPIRATLGGVDQVVFFTAAGAAGVKPDSGAPLWSVPWKSAYDVNAATPLVIGNGLFISSGYASGAGALLDFSQGAPVEVWNTKSLKSKLATAVRSGDSLYGFSEDKLVAVNVRTGEEQWSQLGFGYGTVLLTDGHLIVAAADGRVAVAVASPTGFRTVGITYQILEGSRCWTAPSLSNGRLFLRDNTSIVALDVRPLR